MLESHLNQLTSSLSSKEMALLDELDKHFFETLMATQWENIDMENYWELMDRKELEQPTDCEHH